MKNPRPTRRQFLESAALASLAAPAVAAAAPAIHTGAASQRRNLSTVVLRRPDSVSAVYADASVRAMQFAADAWTSGGCRLRTEPAGGSGEAGLPVDLEVSASGLMRLRLRWNGQNAEDALCLGDHWERAYGDLEWRGMQPERVMPWYFVVRSAAGMQACGVQTGAAAFCFWQTDAEGTTLSINLGNGGGVADLRGRSFTLCTVVQRGFSADQPFHEAMLAFCKSMCPAPRLPPTPLFGVNDWNYAYGKNTAEGILRDADLLASVAPAGPARAHVVIDDGWQDPRRFPSMPDLAVQIRRRSLQPGLWIRPLRATAQTPASLLLPAQRFGRQSQSAAPAFDPTLPEALAQVLQAVSAPLAWGYTLLKHDFTTWEMFGRWGFQMGDQVTAPGWNFYDRRLTNAEVVRALYREMRRAAGDETIVLGCNTVGHLAAGIFQSQRIGDDTSGKDWERTRRMGVNALAQRLAQHGTFFHIDPDIVAITPEVAWPRTRAWMDVVARTGASLFIAPDPAAMTAEAKLAMRDAMALVVQQQGARPLQPSHSTTPQAWQSPLEGGRVLRYKWTPDGCSSAATV